MKRILITIAALAACASFADIEPTGLTLDVTIIGTASPSDKRAMLLVVGQENSTRISSGNTNALPTATAPDLRQSYKTVLAATIARAHASYSDQAQRRRRCHPPRRRLGRRRPQRKQRYFRLYSGIHYRNPWLD